jgi:DNA-binding NtrC family response regulator
VSKKRILLIDNEEGLCRMMSAILEDQGYTVTSFTDPVEAMRRFDPAAWDAVVTDIKMPGMDGLEVLQRIKDKSPLLPVIVITAFATVEMSIQALRVGAYDMLTKPFEPEELTYRVKNAIKQNDLLIENRQLHDELSGRFKFDQIIGHSQALRELLDKVEKVAVRDTTALITGESGSGKELIAQAIHYNSSRSDKRFVAINCGALPESVLESELFGSRKGAFTGATEHRKGLLEEADGGTLFLDEVGNLPLSVQKTLLRFLQEQEFLRIGDTKPTKVDVRIITATNADLAEDVSRGTFREDLFYRINVIKLRLPSLRERREDIPVLVTHFIRNCNEKFESNFQGITPEAMRVLMDHDWPGNIRQLANVIEACLTIESEAHVSLYTLRQILDLPAGELDSAGGATGATGADGDGFNTAQSRFEIDYITSLLRRTDGNVEDAAKIAGMNMATIYRKMKKHGVTKESRP